MVSSTIVSFGCLLVYKDFRRPETLLLAALFAGQCAYSVWVGGDYAEVEVNAANRFITARHARSSRLKTSIKSCP